ncbi:Hypothetical protein FORC77_2392 [Vibrio vulnificus]|nr:Hypothetical protein FORC77_2392 [Vibrio vulnificus]
MVCSVLIEIFIIPTQMRNLSWLCSEKLWYLVTAQALVIYVRWLMDGFELDDLLDFETTSTTKTRSKPVKRKWREIEAMLDRRNLLKELRDMDMCHDYSLEDIKL